MLICIYAAAFFVVTSISTICLYLAYGIPILLHIRNRLPRHETPWSLGRVAPIVNVVAVAWVAVITIVFMLPPNELVLWTMLGVALAMTLYWLASARRNFRRPGIIAIGCESPPPSSSPP